MRIVGTIEARMGSSRLPGKTLMPIYKEMSLLECVINRFRLCKNLNDIVVATTLEAKDQPIADWCQSHRVHVYRGSEGDVLDRVVGAAKICHADAIAQMGADSAYLDYELMDKLISIYTEGDYDYVCNDLVLTYPLGIYGHIVRLSTLAAINQRQDLDEQERVDVVRILFENPKSFRIKNIEAEEEWRHPELRFTIDYPEDLEQARAIYAELENPLFKSSELLTLFEKKPEVFAKTMKLIQQSAPHLSRKP